MKKYFEAVQSIFDDTPFFNYIIPLLVFTGIGVAFYYGYRGIVHKKTISLYKFEHMSARESHEIIGEITGTWAVILGIIYILIAFLLLLAIGGPYVYKWFGPF